MKSLLKFTLAISALATLGSASLFAGAQFRIPTPSEIAPPRVLAPPVADLKCGTMSIQGARGKWELVSCKQYASIRPDDCRRACGK